MNEVEKLEQIDEIIHPGPRMPKNITPAERQFAGQAAGTVIAVLPEIIAALALMRREHEHHFALVTPQPCAGCSALSALGIKLGVDL